MATFRIGLVIALAVGCMAVGAREASAQADPQNFQFLSGQAVAPFFDGWSRNPDGSYEMHFGYINRNYNEEVHVPIGPNNRMDPAPEDRGQPTYFYPRIYHRMFSFPVPADFGLDQEVVWTITTRGEEHRAVGWLQPEWEIFADSGALYGSEGDSSENVAPSLTIEGDRTASVGETLSLVVTVTDDGLPPPREFGGSGQSTPPTLEDDPDAPTIPVNVPALLPENRKDPTRVSYDNVTVTWTQYRGPIGATVEAAGEAEGGSVTMNLDFTHPGEYLFTVEASDRDADVSEELVITVTP